MKEFIKVTVTVRQVDASVLKDWFKNNDYSFLGICYKGKLRYNLFKQESNGDLVIGV